MCKDGSAIAANTASLRQRHLTTTKSNDSVDDEHLDTPTASPTNLKANNNGYIVVEDKSIKEKLFQAKEDRMYLHKILGFSALLSYIYRFSCLGQRDGNLQWGTLYFVAHHLSLNITSFVFDIPKRRVKTGFRIWPEYRIHSLVFTSRNLACILRLWALTHLSSAVLGYQALDNGLVNWMIVMLTCAAADYGSMLSKQHQSNTVRGTDYFDPYANWFASEMQFQLTAVCLSAGYQRYSLHLIGAFIIQFNSFLMTLRRKNVFSHLILTTTYGLMLASAMFIGALEDYYTNDQITKIGMFANMGIILRMGLGVDKYMVWTLLAVGMHLCDYQQTLSFIPTEPHAYYIGFWVTKFICYGLGIRRRAQKIAQRENKNEEVGYSVVLAAGIVYTILFIVDMVDVFGLI